MTDDTPADDPFAEVDDWSTINVALPAPMREYLEFLVAGDDRFADVEDWILVKVHNAVAQRDSDDQYRVKPRVELPHELARRIRLQAEMWDEIDSPFPQWDALDSLVEVEPEFIADGEPVFNEGGADDD